MLKKVYFDADESAVVSMALIARIVECERFRDQDHRDGQAARANEWHNRRNETNRLLERFQRIAYTEVYA